MMFSSKTPRDLNHDREPVIMRDANTGIEGRVARWEASLLEGGSPNWTFEDAPRSEFDHVQHNAPNPILLDFRAFDGIAGMWLDVIQSEDGDRFLAGTPKKFGRITADHIVHAIRVLTYLKKLED